MTNDEAAKGFAAILRKWWSFDDRQLHTHSWHSREDFIEQKLPTLIDEIRRTAVALPEPTEGQVEALRKELQVSSDHDYRPWSQIKTALSAALRALPLQDHAAETERVISALRKSGWNIDPPSPPAILAEEQTEAK